MNSNSGHNKSKGLRDKQTLAILNFLLLIATIVFAITFGIFEILAWETGVNQFKQAEIANQLTLLSYCASASVRKP
jgi:hypothetical protein